MTRIAVVLCLTSLCVMSGGASARQLAFRSPGIAAAIDAAGGRLLSVTNRTTGQVHRITSDVCRIETGVGPVDLARSRMKLSSTTGHSCRFVGSNHGLKLTRTYEFPSGRAYFDRGLAITNMSGNDIVIRRVTDCAISFAASFASAVFHDDNMDQCDPGSQMYSETEKPVVYRTSINIFLRGAKGGLYAGLKYPYFAPDVANNRVSLSYDTNYRLKPGETIDLPTTFIGAYKKTGYICRKDLDWTPRIVTSTQETMDLGEVRAMQQVMRDYLAEEPCPRPGYFTWLNSWWANAELRGKWSDAEATAFCKLADSVKQTKCLDMISTAPVWCGWVGFIEPCDMIDNIGNDAAFPMNPAIEKAMSYVKSLGLPVTGFCEPNSLNRHYRKDRPDWRVQPTSDPGKTLIQNCHANPAYEDWFYRLQCSAIDKCELSAWAWDHCWTRRPMVCYGRTHGHEPGNCEFQQYLNTTGMILKLRKRYPRLFIEVYWGLKEAGPWSLRGLNSLENAYENASPPPPGMSAADDLRFQHWFSHNYRFIPTYLNMAQINFRKEANGNLYSLLSCLSASTHASMADWMPFSTQAEADSIFALMRRWKAWATENMAYLRDRIDLFGMPCRKGGIDGTAHIIGDRGFIFVFNPTNETRRGSVPLTGMIGLTRGARYAIDEISTGSAVRSGVYNKNADFTFDIGPKAALLFQLQPSNEAVSARPLPEGVKAQPAFLRG